MKMTFQPKKRQRSKVHGFRKRMSTANGRKVLARRRAKGRNNWEFQAVYRNGKSKANRCFVMIIKKNDASSNRIGISVSKKVGNSIVRHRVTRVIREVMRLHWKEIKSGYDIVIVARPSAKESDYGKFESAIFHLLNLHHLLLEDDDLE